MNHRTLAIGLVLLAFVALSAYVVAQVGYLGIILPHFEHWGGIQVLVDLVIACTLAIIWMVVDARRRGANPWPFVVITLFAGSIGPLAYLLVREWGSEAAATDLRRA